MSDLVEIVAAPLRVYVAHLPEAGSAAREVIEAIEKSGHRIVPVEATDADPDDLVGDFLESDFEEMGA